MYYVKSDLLMRHHFETGEETVTDETIDISLAGRYTVSVGIHYLRCIGKGDDAYADSECPKRK